MRYNQLILAMWKLFIVAAAISIGKSASNEVEDKFRSSKIVDDLLSVPPSSLLDIEFDCGLPALGNNFTAEQVQNRPKVSWKGAKETENYTLIMTDAQRKKEVLHWLTGNIPGNQVDKGDQLTSFFPSAPPKNSGNHRYVFLLFRQRTKINFQGHEKISTFQMEGRDTFSTESFVESYKLGSPVAGNFYYASWDESCEEMFKQIEAYKKGKLGN